MYTQHSAKPARQQDINTKFSQLLLAQLPRTQFTHSTPPNPGPRTPKRTSDPLQTPQAPRLPRKSPAASAAAREHQSVHQTPPDATSPTPATQKSASAAAREHQSVHQTPRRRNKSHACHAKVQRPARRPANTNATQKSSGQRGGPRTPKRTSDPAQMQQVPRLPRKSPAAPAAAREHQSVHQTPCRRRKPHACHAKVQQSSGQRGGPRTPKRTSDPVQILQVPRLPRKSPAASAAAREHQSIHQTPCRRSKSHACHAKVQRPARRPANQNVHQTPCRRRKPHACHAKVQRPARRPANTKAYIRPPADAASPAPATQKQRLCDAKLRDVKQCDVKLCAAFFF